MEAGDVQGAAASFQHAVDELPDSVPIRLRFAACLMAADRADEAEAQVDRALALSPEHPLAHQFKARIVKERAQHR